MANLDDLSAIRRLDSNGMLANIIELPDQARNGWEEVKKFVLPAPHVKHSNIVIIAAGAAATVAQIAVDIILPTAGCPIIICRNGELPGFVNDKSLVIGASYSGNTPQVVAAFGEAGKAGAKLIGMGTGGMIESLTRKYRAPFYKISYGAKPRAAAGYFLAGFLGIFNKLLHVEIEDKYIEHAALKAKELCGKVQPEVELRKNLAKQLAQRIGAKLPVFIGAGVLENLATRGAQQINSNSKLPAYAGNVNEFFSSIVTGLENQTITRDKFIFIILQSQLENGAFKEYYKIVFESLERARVEYESLVFPSDKNPIAETLQVMLFVDFVSFYLAIVNDRDPEKSQLHEFATEQLQLIYNK